MQIMKKLAKFIENYDSALVVGTFPPTDLLYYNSAATELYGIEGELELQVFHSIFENKSYGIKEKIENGFLDKGYVIVDNVLTKKTNGEYILTDVRLGYFDKDKTEVFIEITPKADTRYEMAMLQINSSNRPEAILNLNDTLSIVHCNDSFIDVFDANDELRYTNLKNDLINGFNLQSREQLMTDIHNTLKVKDYYSTKMNVYSVTGEEHWYSFELEKRTLDNTGKDYIMAYMTNIEKQIELEEENSQFNQHLSFLQEFTSNVMFRVEMPSQTFYHSLNGAFAGKFGNVIPNHVEEFINNKIIHPDDVDKYRQQLREFISRDGQGNEFPIRVNIFGDEYKWCIFRGKKILNSNGEIKEIFGALIDVDNEQKIKEKADTINKYFDALQQVSGESFYVIDIKSKILTQKGKVADELNIYEPLKNFPECVYDLIHKEDLDNFKKHNSNSFNGIPSSVEFRILMPNGDYQWYELNSQAIRDDNGEIVEIVGNIKNINNQKIMQNKFSSLNNHFEALQSISGESIYSINVKNKTLNQKGQVAKDLGFNDIINNYPESVFHMMHPDDLQNYKDFAYNCMDGVGGKLQVRAKNIQGEYVWYEKEAVVIKNDNGEVLEVVGKMNNIHDEKNVEMEYSILQQYFKAMQDLSEDIIFHIDIKTKTFRHNHLNDGNLYIPLEIPNFVDTFIESGYIHPDNIYDYRKYTEKLLTGENNYHKVQALIDTNTYNWFGIKCKYMYNDSKEAIEIFGKMENIQAQVELEEKATIDKLTKALSREAFEEKITKDLNTCSPNISNALIFIDIDNFKFINDNYGHQFGDFILQQFTNRITNCIKDSDVIGRVGGDEFVVYLRDIGTGKIALNRANIMLEHMTRPISDGTITHILGMSMGIAISPINGDNLQTLYSNADKAVYISKELGKNMATLYSEDMAKLELEQKAKMDKVTNTFNEIGFAEAVINDLQNSNIQICNALVCIDIADFKFINSNYGAEFADFILEKFTERMRNCVKKSDVIGRIGWDRFGVYLKDINNSDLALERANTIIERMIRAFTDKDLQHNLDLSIGISLTTDDIRNWGSLYSNACIALDCSKKSEKNTVTIYSKNI